MSVPEKNYITKTVAIVIIILLTLSDFLFVGKGLISYALDIPNTNEQNVEFMAYFLNNVGEKTDKIEPNIDNETKLKIDVSVKQEGYFNGKIALDNSNFKFKIGQENEYINNITEDELTLNQINAGGTVSLELLVEPKISDRINIQTLNSKTKVLLQGSYINSKNIERNTGTEIKGESVVEVNWKSSEKTQINLDASLLTNYVYTDNGEEKRIVQILVDSSITDNNYPIKNNYIAITVPENVKNIEVHTRSTDGTNNNIMFNESNYRYNEKNKTLRIKLENTDENEISWNKNSKDTFVVTYTFEKEENIQNEEIIVGNLINTYDDKNLTAKQSVIIDKEINGIISSKMQSQEEIYKGKIYTEEEREYNVKTVVNVDYLNILEKVVILQNEATFVKGKDELKANIVYKSTKISKDEFLKVFGEDGFITIKDENDVVISNINKNTETDENGKIEVKFINATKAVKMITSKPIAIGTLNIENKKAILDSTYDRSKIDEFSCIKEKVMANHNEENGLIMLKDTETQAEIKINKDTILASGEEEQLEIEATLVADSEDKDLYKNPKVTFVFPSEISVESAKLATLYKNGLEVESSTTKKNENGENVIEIVFAGEQTKYEYTGGTKIYIKAQVIADTKTQTQDTSIKMIYTNEYKNQSKQTEANFTIEATQNIEEQSSITQNVEEIPEIQMQNRTLMMRNQALNAGGKSNNTEENINVFITASSGNKVLTENEEIYEGQTIKYEVTVTNNTGRDYSNVSVDVAEKNGYIWDWCDEEVYNFYYSQDKMIKSFYKESSNNNKELGKVESFKSGESYTYSYEATAYLLNNPNIEGNTIFGTVTVKSENNELDKSQNTISNKIQQAELKVQLTDRKPKDVEMNDGKFIEGLLTLENLTNSQMDNIKIKLFFSKNVEIKENDYGFILKDVGFEDKISVDNITINENGTKTATLSLTSIKPNEIVRIAIQPTIIELENDEENVQVLAKVETTTNNIYYSNRMISTTTKITNHYDIDLTQKVTYKDGKTIDYVNDKIQDKSDLKITGEVLNKNQTTLDIGVQYKIDSALSIKKVVLIDGNEQKDITNEVTSNIISISKNGIKENEKLQLIIDATVNTGKSYDGSAKNVLEVSNYTGFNDDARSELSFYLDKGHMNEPNDNTEEQGELEIIESDIKTSSEPLIIEGKKPHSTENDTEEENKEENKEDNKQEENKQNEDKQNIEDDQQKNNNNQNNINNNNENENNKSKQYSITGIAWIDKNKDGKRENDEEKVKDISVGIVNIQTGNLIGTTKTNSDGKYSFNIEQGNYMVVFYYNDTIYGLTTYQADGVGKQVNSDAIVKTITLNNNKSTVGATDTITVDTNIQNIDIGFVYKSNFDLKIEKYINKIIVKNNVDTKTYEQPENTKLAKAEIKAKNLNDSLVVIEYKIKVKNVGDIEGYAKNIVDFLPSSLSFNSSLNSNWYRSGEYLYNTSLANTKIKPGETKELTLTVTKQMTETNTGLINNKAEIQASSNTLGLEDATKDIGSADVIISVGTGALVQYLISTSSIFLMLTLIAYLINKRRIK